MENKDTLTGLRANCLGFTGVTAMAIALISPTMTAALIIPLMYSNAGNASWLAYLFGTVMLLFVVLRSAFLGTLPNPEPRYTLECYPVVIVLAAALFIGKSHSNDREPA